MKHSAVLAVIAAVLPVFLLTGAVMLWLPSRQSPVSERKEIVRAAAQTPADDIRVAGLARMAARMTENPAALLQAANSLESLTAEQLSTACKEANKLPAETRETALRLLCTRWAEIDPMAAMTWALEKSSPWILWDDIGHTWARRDVSGLLAWYTNRQGEVDPRRMMPIADWVAGVDVGLAARALCAGTIHSSLYGSGKPFQYFNPARRIGSPTGTIELDTRVHSREDIARLIPVAAEYPYEPAQRVIRNGRLAYQYDFDKPGNRVAAIIESVYPKVDPEGWREWIKEHPVNAMGRDSALGLALDEMQSTDSPADVAKQILTASWREPREEVVAQVVASWATRDAKAAGLWLRKQGTGAEVWQAIDAFSAAAIQTDPEAAFAWLEAVPDAAKREQLIERAYDDWHRKNPEVATAWLQNSGWPEERLRSIAEMQVSRPPPPSW